MIMRVASRWTVLLLGAALSLACNEASGPLSLPAAVGRPAEASQGPRVGVIVALGGGVTIVPRTGPAFTAAPDHQLLRDDSLVTASESFVVVQLHNGHLVRLGADQRNVVEMLAPFHDPAAADDLEARFVRLLSPEERDDPALRGAITRVAGWNTRMSAARTFAALPAQAAPAAEARAREAPVEEDVGASAEGSVPALENTRGEPSDEEAKREVKREPVALDDAPPAPPRSGGAAKRKSDSKPVPGGASGPARDDSDGASPREESSNKGSSSSPPSPSSPPPPVSPRLPPQLKFSPAGGGAAQMLGLPAPLKAGSAALARCAGAGAKISGSVKGGKLIALKVDGEIKCQTLVGEASTLDDGSFELTVLP